MPKITVIMPLYNAEDHVEKAISSILGQTYKDFELLLIDDRPTDGTIQKALKMKDPRIKWLHHSKNQGISVSRNEGLDNSSGEYIALMDDDDLVALDRFEKEVAYLDSHYDIDVVGGRVCVIDEQDRHIQLMSEPLRNPHYVKTDLMFYNPMGNGSTMFRKDFVEKYKIRYKDDWCGMEDYHFWIDCSLHGKITNLNDVFLYWRKREKNETARVKKEQEEERRRKYAALQRYAIIQNGYSLEEEEFTLLQRMFPEETFTDIVSGDELKDLYSVFEKMIYQAEQMQAENLKELKIFCRKLFINRLAQLKIWL